jgi:hypothetical protein
VEPTTPRDPVPHDDIMIAEEVAKLLRIDRKTSHTPRGARSRIAESGIVSSSRGRRSPTG